MENIENIETIETIKTIETIEIWKKINIENYENYEVSSLGQVRNIKTNRILQPRNKDGYLIIGLSTNGKTKKFSVHRLVALTFIENLENKPFVNHIDKNKINNSVSNLKWITENEKNKILIKKKYKINNEPILELIGEDRTFGGNELFVDLVPSTCWFTNVRYCVDRTEWDRIRNFIYKRADYKCECCGIDTKINNIRLDAHERWDYNENTFTQKLVRLIALCFYCHQSTHIGLAGIIGKYQEAFNHLQKIRNFTDIECKIHIDDAFTKHRYRSKIEWNLDLSLIENNNIKLSNKVSKIDRYNICKKKLENI